MGASRAWSSGKTCCLTRHGPNALMKRVPSGTSKSPRTSGQSAFFTGLGGDSAKKQIDVRCATMTFRVLLVEFVEKVEEL